MYEGKQLVYTVDQTSTPVGSEDLIRFHKLNCFSEGVMEHRTVQIGRCQLSRFLEHGSGEARLPPMEKGAEDLFCPMLRVKIRYGIVEP